MPRKRPTPGLPEQLADLTFPVGGLDLTQEFEDQRPQTTPSGQNVRVYEALTQRGRGGSRPGLAQYVPQQVDGVNLIQHLNYIVDPQADALATGFDPLDTPIPILAFGWGFGPGPFLDYGFPTLVTGELNPRYEVGMGGVPLGNGYYTRTGGNGIQPNPNVGTATIPLPPPFVPPPPPPPLTLTISWNNSDFVINFSDWISAHSDGMHTSFGNSTWEDGLYVNFAVTGGSAGPYSVDTLSASSSGFDVGDTPTVDTPGDYSVTISGASGTGLSQFGSVIYVGGTISRSF